MGKKNRPGRGSEGKRAASLNPGGVPKANRNNDSMVIRNGDVLSVWLYAHQTTPLVCNTLDFLFITFTCKSRKYTSGTNY